MAIPPVAPTMEADNEAAEGEMTVSISCAAADCKFNSGGKCAAPSINVSAGPDAKCETYEAGGDSLAGGSKIPRPPLPPMTM